LKTKESETPSDHPASIKYGSQAEAKRDPPQRRAWQPDHQPTFATKSADFVAEVG